MAKMFYTLEEAAAKLGKTADEIRAMAASGQLPEFRDRDRLMFKVEHVDLIAGGKKDDDDIIPLADSGELEPVSLSSSGSASAMGLESPKEQTGISIFDADATEEADPSAVTRITNAPTAKVEDPGRSGSGSGLLDMTRDVDDTSLGANLLDDVYGGQETVAQTATDEPAQDGTGVGMAGGALFETPAAAEGDAMAGGAAAPAYVVQESYDGAGSGLVGGFAVGAVASLLLSAFAIVMGMTGSGSDVLKLMGDNIWAFVGGLGGLTFIGGMLGWFMGRKG